MKKSLVSMDISSDVSGDRKANDEFKNAIFPYIPFKVLAMTLVSTGWYFN